MERSSYGIVEHKHEKDKRRSKRKLNYLNPTKRSRILIHFQISRMTCNSCLRKTTAMCRRVTFQCIPIKLNRASVCDPSKCITKCHIHSSTESFN